MIIAAGVAMRVPRTRGDGPDLFSNSRGNLQSVPRTRGDGPLCRDAVIIAAGVFPAHAGMDRWRYPVRHCGL